MAYRYGNREQAQLFPVSIDDYVAKDAPVRAYDAFIEALNLEALGIAYNPHAVGNSQYDPKAMLKLLVYGYSYGVRSSRKLERETHYNLSFIWLLGGLKPDHKTIAEFRRNNKQALKKALTQCAQLCLKLNLIVGNTLFVDGSKIRANAAIKNTWTPKKCAKVLGRVEQRIEEILSECETIDLEEASQPSLVKLRAELQDKEALKTRIKGILNELDASKEKSLNTIDPECTRINSIQGSHAGYNVQLTVDEQHGLIVNSDVVNENNDLNQFARQIDMANEVLGEKCATAVADSGYATTDELKKIADQGIQVIVPSQRQAANKEIGEFAKEKFCYDAVKDCYVCPEGQELRYYGQVERARLYRAAGQVCRSCINFGRCTKSKRGRQISRLKNEAERLRLEAEYLKAESQAISRLRQQRVELPFGHIKRNLGVGSFLMRGLEGAQAELSLLALCFNVRRLITLLGVGGMMGELALLPV